LTIAELALNFGDDARELGPARYLAFISPPRMHHDTLVKRHAAKGFTLPLST
jgi:hypothetical protein